VSAVSAYLHPHTTQPSQFTKPSRWVKTTETADHPAPVKAADPTPFVGPPPAGVTYIAAADQLPAVATLPKAIGFDIETFNRRTDLWRHKASLSPALGGEIRLAQISTSDSEPTLVIDVAVIGQPALDWLAQIVRTPDRLVVGHNLLFEATFLIAAGIRPLCRWWDTMLASQLIGDLSSNSLASCAKHYLGREIDKGEQLSNWGSELTAGQLAYAALDAVAVRPLAKRLREELQATGQEEAHRLDCQMISPCADGQVRGLAVDLQMVDVARQHATAERDQKVATLQQLLGLENYRNAIKLKEALAEHLGQPLADAKGATLERYRGFPAVDLLLEIKELDTELKEITWLEQEQALTDGRIRPTYKILGARTGRTTTSALVPLNRSQVPSDTEVFGPKAQKAGQAKPVKLGQLGFNFQGLTGDRKKALSTGTPNTVLLDLDWSSIEVRLQASPRLYNDDGQRKILLEGIDPHAYIASQVCGRQITKDDPERSTIGKTANFSLAYGCGVKNLARQLELAQGKSVSYGQAEKVYKAWHRFHPQISQLMARFDDGARITETRSLSGRRMTVRGPSIDNDSTRPMLNLGRTNGINFPIQGSGRDLLADALGDLWPALEAFPGTHVVGLIHDEILLEVPRQHVDGVKAAALEAMTSQRLQDAYLGDIPLEADASVGDTWGEVH
jgi:DNA polymerase I-like protein with 3'-5' exonuclease and polymerase domains